MKTPEVTQYNSGILFSELGAMSVSLFCCCWIDITPTLFVTKNWKTNNLTQKKAMQMTENLLTILNQKDRQLMPQRFRTV